VIACPCREKAATAEKHAAGDHRHGRRYRRRALRRQAFARVLAAAKAIVEVNSGVRYFDRQLDVVGGALRLAFNNLVEAFALSPNLQRAF
jgi:hypothetical protein